MKTRYHHARVYTGELPLQQAFLVEDGHFLRVGSEEDSMGWTADSSVDLGGSFVCAGFNDSHMHILNYGQSLTMAPLYAHTGSMAEMLDCLRRRLAESPPAPGQWLTGRGWNQDFFTDEHRMPTRYDLDRVSTEVPILAVRACGHAVTVNSRALECIGITADTPRIPGGEIVMEDGVPNGILLDNALDLAYDCLPVPTFDMVKDMLRAGMHALNCCGITSAQSDDYNVFAGVDWRMVNRAFRELEEAGEMTVRVYEQCNFTRPEPFREFVEAGFVTGAGSDIYRIGPLKMVGDGALGARTAFLTNPYADDPNTRGLSVFTQECFDEMIGFANAHGMQTAIHAIGDAGLDMVIHAMERALTEHPREDHRMGIVHCQITRRDQLEKLAAMKAHIYCQSIFLDYDSGIVEARVGKELASTSYSWKTLKKLGATVSNGSDCPVELPRVMSGIQCAVTRQPLYGSRTPYLPEEAFTVAEALDSFTSGGAWASFDEHRKGRIAPGMLADFTVLGDNPFDTDPRKLAEIPVLAVYLGGREVYRAE